MPEQRYPMSRRAFLSANATLLAGFGLSQLLPGRAEAAQAATRPAASGPTAPGDLALYRPVTVSSTAYGPTPAEFAVDGLAETGVRGTGWRAASTDPQWIAVDLQAPCSIESVVLVFEATTSDPAWTPAQGSNPYVNTTGWEVMSSCATAFQLDVSADGTTWSTVYQTTSGTGGTMRIPLAQPVSARWVRMTATQQSNDTPLQVNGFQVYGTCDSTRPPATGWSNWGQGRPGPAPALATAPDGTVPVESGWALTLDAWAGTADGATLSTGAADTAGWVSATVPGTVLASLVEQGHFPRPRRGLQQPAHSRGPVTALVVVPAGLQVATGVRHERQEARLAGVRRHQPPRRDLAQRHFGRRAHPSLRPRGLRRHQRPGQRRAGTGRAHQPDATSG